MSETLSDLYMTFWMCTESSTNGVLSVGYVTADDTSTFVAISNYPASSATMHSGNGVQPTYGQMVELSLATVPSSATRLAFKWVYTTSFYSCCIDNVSINYPPTCPKVENLTVTPGVDDATISWLEAGSATNWLVEVHAGDVEVFSQVVNTNPYTVTGLSSNTAYTVSVRAVCSPSDTSDARLTTFRTECDLISTLPYVEDFEDSPTGSSTTGSPFANCMIRINNGTSYGGYPYVSATSSYNHTPGGTKGLYWYLSTTATTYGDYEYMVLPGLDTDLFDISNLQLRFWARATATSYNPVFQVGVMTDPSDVSTFQLIGTVNVGGNTTYNEFTVTFDSFTGYGQYVAVRALRPSSAWYATMDDVVLEPMPTCQPIADLEATATVGSALLTWRNPWTTEPDGYVGTYDSINSTGTGTTLNVYETSVLLTGLAPNTEYKVYVQADCGSGDYGRLDSVTFTTAQLGCLGQTEVPFSTSTAGVSGCLAYSSWGNTAYQALYTAAELTAAGLTAGPISALDLGFTSSTYDK
jgi:hypothetical protein